MTFYRFLLRSVFTFIARRRANTFGRDSIVNGYTVLSKNTKVGSNCHFNGAKVLGQGSVVIMDNFHSGPDLIMLTTYHDYTRGDLPYGKELISKDILIESNVWIGRGVIILGGVKLGEGCIIQAGSVVSSDVPRMAIVGGNPARPFKYRDEENYNGRL